MDINDKTFWLDDFSGKATGGYFIRNDLFKFIKRLKEAGHEPVGISINMDSYNLEIFIKDK